MPLKLDWLGVIDGPPLHGQFHPYNKKRGCEINEAPGLLSLFSLLGVEKSYVRGRGQFGRLFLKTNQVNT